MLDSVQQDVRYVARILGRMPAFTAVPVLTLALGIGATTAIFSVVNAVLINPLPYPNPDTLVRIVHSIGGVDQPYFSDVVYLTYVDNTRTIQDVGAGVPERRRRSPARAIRKRCAR